jgi:hypothetical protein
MKTIVAHRFTVGDVEDPDIYAAEPLWKWQNSEAGKWAMENCAETPSWHRVMDPAIFGYSYQVKITLTPKQLVYWKLKYE